MAERPLALITGASRGIGAATARALADTHDILLGGRDRTSLEEQQQAIPGAKVWPVELTDESATAAAAAEFDRLDVLVHSAGVVEIGSTEELSTAAWRRSFEVNLFAITQLTRQLLPALRAAQGHIALVNSGSGITAKANWGAYAASKFALRGFADALRAEESPNGLRVTSVFPGRVATDMQRTLRQQEGGDYEPERYLRPESVADHIVSAIRSTADAHPTEIMLRPS